MSVLCYGHFHFMALNRGIFLLMFFISFSSSNAQLLDSISLSIKEKPRLLFKLDGRGSFISTRSARIWGFKVGVEHNDRVQYGIGYSWLRNEISQEVELNGEMVPSRVRFGYLTPFFEYAFYQRNKWEVSIPVQVGLGQAWYEHKDDQGEKYKVDKTWVFMYEPAMTVEYRVFRFFGAGIGVGYRLAIKTNRAMEENFTAPIYLLKLKLYLPEVLNVLR